MNAPVAFAAWSSAALVAAQVVVAQVGPQWLWGLHHLAFYPPACRWAAVALALVALGTIACGRPRVALPPALRVRLPVPAAALTAAVFALAATAFFGLRIRHLLFGDAAALAGMLREPHALAPGGANEVVLLAAAFRLAAAVGDPDPIGVFAVSSALAGGLFAALALALARTWSEHAPTRAFAFAVLLGTGAVQLFCGYVEHYTLTTVAALATLYGLARWQGHRAAWLAGALLAGAIAFLLHPMALYLGFPLAFAAGWQAWARLRRPALRRAAAAALGLALAGALYWIAFAVGLNPLAPSGRTPGYGLFSRPHLLDWLNVWLLALPLHAPLAAYLLGRGRSPVRDPVFLCLALAAGAATGLSFCVEPKMGSLDWDLLSVHALPVAALTAWLVGRGIAPAQQPRALGCFAVGALFHIAPWVAANADADRGARMVEAMTVRDHHHRLERDAILGGRLLSMGQSERAIRRFREALERNPADALALYNLAMAVYATEGVDAGLALFDRFLAVAPAGADTRLVRSLIARHRGPPGAAAGLCAAFLLDHPRDGKAVHLARALAAATPGDRERRILQVATLCAEGKSDEALGVGAVLLERHGADPEVTAFLRAFRQRCLPDAPAPGAP